jgi:tetratricopeptide (TPR) repeat protein
MATSPGHDSGHEPAADAKSSTDPGFSWADHLAWLVEKHGSLAAVAERLSALRGYKEDVATIERALRRLRSRGQLDGGTWGSRLLTAFGLPGAVDARARWMGAYHSRFTDLPLPVCRDLVRLWDRPPISDAPASRIWLALAHTTCALRGNERDNAKTHLQRARASFAKAPPEARAEVLLIEAYLASRDEVHAVPAMLTQVQQFLSEPMPKHDQACLYARWIDQQAYEKNRSAPGKTPDHAAAEALYRSIEAKDAPAFTLCRRANGLAYALWKQGLSEEAAACARRAVEHAGDGGHLRLRAMALNMLARIVSGPEAEEARERAATIAASLDDEALQMRFERGWAREKSAKTNG